MPDSSGRTGLISREEAMEILEIARTQGDYSLGSLVPRALTTIIVLYAQIDGLNSAPTSPKGSV